MILVTGATGLLGSHLLRQLTERGENPRAIGRKISKRSFLADAESRGLPIDFRSVDLSEPIDPQLFEGIDTVIHSAALASPFPEDYERMRAINVTATQALFGAAVRAGVSKWIQVSTAAALGGATTSGAISESNGGTPRSTGYAATKLEIDRWIEAQTDKIRATFIHPGYLLDEWDARPSSGAIFFALRLGKISEYVNSTKNFVAARDVARATLATIDFGKSGHYLIGGENVAIREFFKMAEEELKLAPSSLRERSTLAEVEDPIVREFCDTAAVDFSKAERELAYHPSLGTREIIRTALEYFQRFKMLRIR